jgi:hypothetical protein
MKRKHGLALTYTDGERDSIFGGVLMGFMGVGVRVFFG